MRLTEDQRVEYILFTMLTRRQPNFKIYFSDPEEAIRILSKIRKRFEEITKDLEIDLETFYELKADSSTSSPPDESSPK